MRRRGSAAALSVAIAVSCAACSFFGGGSRAKLVCPVPVVAPNLDTAEEFAPGNSRTPDDIRFGVKITAITSNCRNEDVGLRADTRVVFTLARNDPDLRQHDFSYFVAIADQKRNIIDKRDFTVHVEFAPRQNELRIADATSEHLPLRDVSKGGNYAIIIGLELTPEQLDFNRKRGLPPSR